MDYGLLRKDSEEIFHTIYKINFDNEKRDYEKSEIGIIAKQLSISITDMESFLKDLLCLRLKLFDSNELSDQSPPSSSSRYLIFFVLSPLPLLLFIPLLSYLLFYFGPIADNLPLSVSWPGLTSGPFLLFSSLCMVLPASYYSLYLLAVRGTRDPVRGEQRTRSSSISCIPLINDLLYRFRVAKRLDSACNVFIGDDFGLVFEVFSEVGE